jgi:hypothetical protein
VLAVVLFAGAPASAQALPGQALAFDRSKGNCLTCHDIKGGDSPGNLGPPLADMKARFPDRKELRAIVFDETRRASQLTWHDCARAIPRCGARSMPRVGIFRSWPAASSGALTQRGLALHLVLRRFRGRTSKNLSDLHLRSSAQPHTEKPEAHSDGYRYRGS